jgi:hypothetical protein
MHAAVGPIPKGSAHSVATLACAALLLVAGCGGQVAQTARGGGGDAGISGAAADGSGGSTSGGSTSGGDGGGSASSIVGDDSCASLADCCSEFQGAEAASCNAVADADDSQACSNQVDTYLAQGFCH